MTKLIPLQRLLALLLSTSFLTLAACGGATDADGEEQASSEIPRAQSSQALVADPSTTHLAAPSRDPRNEQLQREIDEIREQRRQTRQERQEQVRLAREAEPGRERATLQPAPEDMGGE